MAYTKTIWVDSTDHHVAPVGGGPGLSAVNFNKIEVGVDEAHDLKDRFDEVAMAGAGEPQVLAFYQGNAKWGPKTLFSTDIPSLVRETVAGTTYTTALLDEGKLKEFTSTGAVTLTIAAVGRSDAVFLFRQYGTGLVSMVGDTGVTLSSRGGALKSAGQHAEWQVTRRGTTSEFIVSGDIAV